jgi:hypothetical protein
MYEPVKEFLWAVSSQIYRTLKTVTGEKKLMVVLYERLVRVPFLQFNSLRTEFFGEKNPHFSSLFRLS